MGRFISPDSIVPNFADPQALNRYAYVRNNPLIYTDPSGQSWLGDALHNIFGHIFDDIRDHSEVLGVALQFFSPIPLGQLVGTGILTQSKAGKRILNNEILVASAVMTLAGVPPIYIATYGALASAAQVGLEGGKVEDIIQAGAMGFEMGYVGGVIGGGP